jgi:hypothetical protein
LSADDAAALRRLAASLGVRRANVIRLAVRTLSEAAADWPALPLGELSAVSAVEPTAPANVNGQGGDHGPH